MGSVSSPELSFYRKVNARLVDVSGVAQAAKIVDLGCGTGGISKLILDRIGRRQEHRNSSR